MTSHLLPSAGENTIYSCKKSSSVFETSKIKLVLEHCMWREADTHN